MIKSSSIICVYGMSFGITDLRWWESITKWLKNDINYRLIIFAYDESFDRDASFIDYYNKVENVKSKFLQFTEGDKSMMDRLSSQIIVSYNNDVFSYRPSDVIMLKEKIPAMV